MTTAIADLTPAFLTAALAEVTGGATVTGVDVTVVGTGQMGDCVRLQIAYDRPDVEPRTLVAKLPSADENSRAAAVMVRAYEIEVNFYRSLARGLSVRAPRCYAATLDLTDNDFVLLLEDIAAGRQGDQLAGCTPDEAAAAMAQLPGMHAPRWGDPHLAGLDWLNRSSPEGDGMFTGIIRALHPGFVDRYAERLPPDVVDLSFSVVASLESFNANRPRPWTVTHGDFRLDNLLFPTDPVSGEPVVVVDWQTCSYGPGIADLAYFVGGSLSVEDRRTHEQDLVRDYQQRMAAAGVDLAWDDLWSQYRRYTVGGLVMAIIASMVVKRTDRGDDMFVAMAERAGWHALDLEAMTLVA